jgi:hypothetical protein
MGNEDFVVLGLEDVFRAVEVAQRRGWTSRTAPAAMTRALHSDPRCTILTRSDARVDVVVTPVPLPCRAAGWWTPDRRVALDPRGLGFRTLLHSCAPTERLVADLVPTARAVAI